MKRSNIVTDESLTSFFYKNLDKINKNSLCPIPQEFLWYSSEVLNAYAFSSHKVDEQILGVEFLEAEKKSLNEKKKIYKEIGDMTLVQLGLFPQRLKMVGENYYIQIGKSAYSNMEHLDCNFYDIPNFFKLFSTSFESVINLLSNVREVTQFENFNEYLLQTAKFDINKVS